MIKLDHLTIFVSDYRASREWYTSCFGLHVAFENVASGVGGLEDDAGVELLLEQRAQSPRGRDCVLTFQCDSVHDKYQGIAGTRDCFYTWPYVGQLGIWCRAHGS